MTYFPTFLKLDDKKIIIIGGGFIAFEKLTRLLDFTTNIQLIAKEYNDEIKSLIDENNLIYMEKEYSKGDIDGFDIIIAAIDDIVLQEEIYIESRNYNCLCNCVDVQKYCDFIFPSYIKKGDLTIAISTSGASPAMAKYIRIFISNIIPDSIVSFLNDMKNFRKSIPKGGKRMKFLDNKAKNYVDTWRKN